MIGGLIQTFLRALVTLDELAAAIGRTGRDPAVQQLSSLLLRWKNDNTTVEALRDQVERFIGNAWIEREESHKAMYAVWSSFAANEIAAVQGMTMNERLHTFGLAQQFDEASTTEQRSRLYAKLLAKP
jgi:hypothetical protein